MFKVVIPDNESVHEIQRNEYAYYWSGCFEMVLRKHGLISASTVDQYTHDLKSLNIFSRHTVSNKFSQNLPEYFLLEGAVNKEVADNFNLDYESHLCNWIDLKFDQGDSDTEMLSYARMTVRRIPESRGEISEPYFFESNDVYWNNRKFQVQVFQETTQWKPCAWAKFNDNEEYFPVAVSDGNRVILGFPLFDLIIFSHVFPPLNIGYYEMLDSVDCRKSESWIINQVMNLAKNAGIPFPKISNWPENYSAALSVRYDYDRKIEDSDLESLVRYFKERGFTATWGILKNQCEPNQIKLLEENGHEIALHSVANTYAEFVEENVFLDNSTGIKARGSTSHGGIGSVGYVGNVSQLWQEHIGMLYGEMLGKTTQLPHAFIKIDEGKPVVSSLMFAPCHNSLDTGTAEHAHNLELLKEALPQMLKNGEHVVVMSHPDIHQKELKSLFSLILSTSIWKVTFEECLSWVKNTKYQSKVEIKDNKLEIRFTNPLSMGLYVDFYYGGNVKAEIIEKGSVVLGGGS